MPVPLNHADPGTAALAASLLCTSERSTSGAGECHASHRSDYALTAAPEPAPRRFNTLISLTSPRAFISWHSNFLAFYRRFVPGVAPHPKRFSCEAHVGSKKRSARTSLHAEKSSRPRRDQHTSRLQCVPEPLEPAGAGREARGEACLALPHRRQRLRTSLPRLCAGL